MARPVKPRRSYDSSRRRESAEATRRRIVEAAMLLFSRDGYAATSVAAVAREAGVSPRTVYLGFETKGGLVRAAWHLALRGERDQVPVREQAWFREVLDEPDPGRMLDLNARNARVVKERAGGMLRVLRGAAAVDADVAALWQRIQTDFHAIQGTIAAAVAERGSLRADLDVAAATDVMWTLNHPDVWELLVGARGWTPARYERWLAEAFRIGLLAPGAGGPGTAASARGGQAAGGGQRSAGTAGGRSAPSSRVRPGSLAS